MLDDKLERELIKESQAGKDIKLIVNTVGFNTLNEKVQDEISSLRIKMNLSNNPNEVFGIVKEIKGMEAIFDIANELIDRGEDASKQLLN